MNKLLSILTIVVAVMAVSGFVAVVIPSTNDNMADAQPKNPVAICASQAHNSSANQCHFLNPHSNSSSP